MRTDLKTRTCWNAWSHVNVYYKKKKKKCSHSPSIFVIHLNLSLPKSLLKATCRCGSEVKRRSSFISPRSDQRPGASQQWTLPSPLLTTAWKLQDYREWVRRTGIKQQATNFLFLIFPLHACFMCLSNVKCVNIQIIYAFLCAQRS